MVAGEWLSWGMGFSLELTYFDGVPEGARAGWWGGNGGSMAFIDLDRRMALGFVPNRWISGPHETDRAPALVAAAYESLDGRR